MSDVRRFCERCSASSARFHALAERACILVVFVFLVACSQQAATPSLALAIPINLRCTTCDDFIACRAAGAAPNAETGRAPETIYRLKEKTFWAQIATIGDYITQLWREKTTDKRPLAIYRDTGRDRAIEFDATWRADIDATAHIIRLPDGVVSQTDGVWYAPDGTVRGQCTAMPRRAGYALVREYLGKPPLPMTPPQ